jgi:hypothetical protein
VRLSSVNIKGVIGLTMRNEIYFKGKEKGKEID